MPATLTSTETNLESLSFRFKVLHVMKTSVLTCSFITEPDFRCKDEVLDKRKPTEHALMYTTHDGLRKTVDHNGSTIINNKLMSPQKLPAGQQTVQLVPLALLREVEQTLF